MSDSLKTKFPSFFDWIEAKDIPLEPYQWELVRALDDNTRKEEQQRIGFHVSKQGNTILHKLWWQYHGERATSLGIT